MSYCHPLSQIPQKTLDLVADYIREDQLDGPDLNDIAVAIDCDEEDFTGPGRTLFHLVWILTLRYEVSAHDIISEALIVLGWE